MTLLIDIRGGMSLDGVFPALRVGEAYYGRVTASGGTPFYTYQIIDGALPAGLTLDTITGEVTGTTTSNKMTAITVQAKDLQGMSVESVFVIPGTVNIAAPKAYTDIWEYKVVGGNLYPPADSFHAYDDIPWLSGRGGFGSYNGGPWTGSPNNHGWVANTEPVGGMHGQIFNRGYVFAGQQIIIRSDDGGRAWIGEVLVKDWGDSSTFIAKWSGVLITQCADGYPDGSYNGIFLGTEITNP